MRLFNCFKSETTPKSIERSVRRTLYADPRLRDLDVPRIRIAANELTKQLREMLQADSRLKALARTQSCFRVARSCVGRRRTMRSLRPSRRRSRSTEYAPSTTTCSWQSRKRI